MYKLVITTGTGPSKKVVTKQFWMTQMGFHEADDMFQELQHKQDVMKLELWRQDLHGIYVLKRWRRENE